MRETSETTCTVCGMEVENGLCSGCQMPPEECKCEMEEEE